MASVHLCARMGHMPDVRSGATGQCLCGVKRRRVTRVGGRLGLGHDQASTDESPDVFD